MKQASNIGCWEPKWKNVVYRLYTKKKNPKAYEVECFFSRLLTLSIINPGLRDTYAKTYRSTTKVESRSQIEEKIQDKVPIFKWDIGLKN